MMTDPFALCAVLAVFCLSPGPAALLGLSQGLVHGPRAAMRFAAGAGVASAGLLVVLLHTGAVAQVLPALGVMRYAGGLFLLFLAWLILRAAPLTAPLKGKGALPEDKTTDVASARTAPGTPPRARGRGLFAAVPASVSRAAWTPAGVPVPLRGGPGFVCGALVQALNPQFYIFAQALTAFAPEGSLTEAARLAGLAGGALFGGTLLWAAGGCALRRLWPARAATINALLALALSFLAAALFVWSAPA